LPFYVPAKSKGAFSGNSLRILLANVNTENRRYDLVQKMVIDENPDIIILEEISDEWMSKIGGLKERYPHHLECPQDDNFGMALFSRIPLLEPKILFWGEYRLAYIEASLEFDRREIFLLAVHTLPPVRDFNWRMRNLQLDDMASIIRKKGNPSVLAGDLNVTPWSLNFKRFQNASGLKNSLKGFGSQPSWPTMLPPLLIPLDQCLLSNDIRVLKRKIGRGIGSDHYPLMIEIGFDN
jgi:endonuclease/exonuclease/phosphatase (EEP) superfamily protein YafD